MKRDPQMGARGRRWMREQGQVRRRIIEVGVHEGNGTAALAAHGAHVWAVDRWAGPNGKPRDVMYQCVVERFRDDPRVTVVRSDSVAAAGQLLKEHGPTFDLVFIDADHAYEAVRADIEAYLPLVVPGGTLAGHDYSRNWPGVVRAVDEAFGDRAATNGAAIWQVRP